MISSHTLVIVCEGKGEVEALPNLCSRILHHLGRVTWRVQQDPIRIPRDQLVNKAEPDPLRRTARVDGFRKAIAAAAARRANALLVVIDADDDCPARWGPSAMKIAKTEIGARPMNIDAVMAVREYESWLLHGLDAAASIVASSPDPETIRDAKGALRRLVPAYKPTTSQLALTRQIEIGKVRERSRSFRKLVAAVDALTQ